MDLQPLTVESDFMNPLVASGELLISGWRAGGLADASRHGRRGQSAIDRPRDKAGLGALWSYATHKNGSLTTNFVVESATAFGRVLRAIELAAHSGRPFLNPNTKTSTGCS
jgi:hypothetical protein